MVVRSNEEIQQKKTMTPKLKQRLALARLIKDVIRWHSGGGTLTLNPLDYDCLDGNELEALIAKGSKAGYVWITTSCGEPYIDVSPTGASFSKETLSLTSVAGGLEFLKGVYKDIEVDKPSTEPLDKPPTDPRYRMSVEWYAIYKELRAGNNVTTKGLSEALGVSTNTIGYRLRKMTKAGWIASNHRSGRYKVWEIA